MSLSITTSTNRLMALLSASTTFGTNDDSARWPTAELTAALLAADGVVAEAICMNKNHPRRKVFLTGTGSDVAHGSSLTSRIGPLESVTFVIDTLSYPGIELPIDQMWRLNRENLNPDALVSLEPHYILDGDTIYHNKAGLVLGGAAVAVNTVFCVYSNNGSTLQCPDEMDDAVLAVAAAAVRGKEGAHLDATGAFRAWADAWMEWIRTGPVGPRPVLESPA